MWHFHQLLRTQLQIASTPMKRVWVPFEIIASSVKLVESLDEQQHPRTELHLEVKTDTRCFVHVQVFWQVKMSALDGVCRGAWSPRAERRIKQPTQRIDAILPTRAARTAIHAMRSLPRKIYDGKTPHRLLEDEIDRDNSDDAPRSLKRGPCLSSLFGESDSFRSCSVVERYYLSLFQL